MSPPRTEALSSLQALRGVAALGVVLVHLLTFEQTYMPGTPIVPAAFGVGRAGVDLFFVLSGFFFAWTTMTSPGGGGESARFVVRRLTRIYPAYWVYCLLLLAVHLAVPARFPADTDVLASVLLLPTGRPTLLLVSWTLVFEVYFYLVFAVVLYFGDTAVRRLWMLSVWVGGVVAARFLLSPARSNVALDLVLSPLVLEFLAGCVAAIISQAIARVGMRRSVSEAALWGGLSATVLAFVWTETLYAHPWWRVCAFGISAATLLLGCSGNEAWLRRTLPRGLVLLGDASYSLYLSHLLTIGVAGLVWSHFVAGPSPVSHAAGLAFALGASVMMALLAYRMIEKPLLRGMHPIDGLLRRFGRVMPA